MDAKSLFIDYLDTVRIFKFADYNIFTHHSSELFLPDKRKTLLFIYTSWFHSSKTKDIIYKLCTYDIDNIVILYNSPDDKYYYDNKLAILNSKIKNKIDILFCNNNAFIDENIFDITNTTNDRKYDLVINSRFKIFKNVNWAHLCTNTVHIGYVTEDEYDIELPNFGEIVNKTNKPNEQISLKEVSNILNNSKVGGIFSKIEGNCRASSEYLLCGLPVISVKSEGGRDIWYNENNSIICDDNDISIKNALDICIKKLEDGTFDRQKIRNDHIKQTIEHRQILIDYTIKKIIEYGEILNDCKIEKISKDICSFHK